MFATAMSNSTLSEEASSVCSLNPMVQFQQTQNTNTPQQPTKVKRKRNLPGNPDPEAEVIALSPKSLLATNRFVCEICKKGFQRDQNLQLHRRGHNLPWKLKQRNSKELGMIKKKVYVCPEPTCVHHNPTRALGDLTGIKKHFCRKHGERKFKCEKCSKIYAVFSDWKAHSKTCGTREYRCDCGTLFSRKDSFITHRAFCDALAEESAKVLSSNPLLMNSPLFPLPTTPPNHHPRHQFPSMNISLSPNNSPLLGENNKNITAPQNQTNNYPNIQIKPEDFSSFFQPPLEASPFAALHVSMQPATSSANLSATALLQKAATMGHVTSGMTGMLGFGAGLGPLMGHMGPADMTAGVVHHPTTTSSSQDQQMGATWDHQKSEDYLTRDFLGLAGAHHQYGGGSGGGGFDILEYGAAAASVPTGFGYVAEAEARAAGSDTWGPC